ncbi:MAG: flagellin [Acidobacteriota bacterium]
MAFSIQTNVNSLVAQENLRVNQEFQSKTIERLTSGYRINASGDDAAGLAVANKFRSDTTELTQGVRNANDGISQMQIIDGGLNNISKILDRMKTLATQSSSATFTGNRATLNTEFSQLLSEIDRQASNIGLNTNGAFNKRLDVYIGGATNGSAASNAKVAIDLSGAATAVDTKGLGLSGASVAGAAIDLGAINTGFNTGAAMTFAVTTVDSNGASYTKVFTGLSGPAVTSQAIVDNLNNQLAADAGTANAGITFAIGADGNLKVGGNKAFLLTTTGAAADQLLAANVTDKSNAALYNATYATLTAATAAYTVTFKNANGDSRTVSIANADTAAAQVTKLNAQLKDIGISALLNGANTLSLQSNSDFTWTATDTTHGGVGQVATGGAPTAADQSLSATSAAQSALARIQNAVTLLGNTQGKVGAGQNKLQYAINLAQSQISSFSAAESRIRDADVASEAANLTKAQVLQQASIAAMSQANSAPQMVLSLLRG